MDTVQELLQFLNRKARPDVKSIAVEHILSLTGSQEGLNIVYTNPEILKLIFQLTFDYANDPVSSKDAVSIILNVSSEQKGIEFLLENIPDFIKSSTEFVLNDNCYLADSWAMVLSNVSNPFQFIEQIFESINSYLEKLILAFVKVGYNKKQCTLNYIAHLFSNLTQCHTGRTFFYDNINYLESLLPFLSHESSIRRAGIMGVIKNICFDSTKHSQLLNEINLLPFILLPLAGPEEFNDEETDMLPIELQYLDADKTREPDTNLRKILLESLSQLCATRKGREYLRSNGTYEILRELHKWECKLSDDGNETPTLLVCEHVVDVLIRTEDEIGQDNLKEIEIPADVIDKFNKEL